MTTFHDYFLSQVLSAQKKLGSETGSDVIGNEKQKAVAMTTVC